MDQSVSDSADFPDELVLSTETAYGLRLRMAYLAIFGLIPIGVALAIRFDPTPPAAWPEWQRAAGGVLMAVVMLGIGVPMALLKPRGQWIIDRQGIRFAPLRGGSARIGWRDVRSFHQDTGKTWLRSDTAKLIIYWWDFEPALARHARDYIAWQRSRQNCLEESRLE